MFPCSPVVQSDQPISGRDSGLATRKQRQSAIVSRVVFINVLTTKGECLRQKANVSDKRRNLQPFSCLVIFNIKRASCGAGIQRKCDHTC